MGRWHHSHTLSIRLPYASHTPFLRVLA